MQHTKGYRHAVRVIVEKEGSILLGSHCNKKGTRLMYLFPGGGVDEGESLEQAAVKEVKEEVGLAIKNIRPIGHETYYDKKFDKPSRAKLYKGSHDVWLCAKYSSKDTSQLGVKGDSFNYEWMHVEEVVNIFQWLPQDNYTKRILRALEAYKTFLIALSLKSHQHRLIFKVW